MSQPRRGLLFGALGVASIVPDATLVRLVDAPSLTAVHVGLGLRILVVAPRPMR